MERLTDKRVGYTKLQDNADIDDVVEKLGELEDILEKHNIKDLKELDNKLEVLEILKEHFYETYVLGNGKISYLFRLNQNQDNEKLKNYFERKK